MTARHRRGQLRAGAHDRASPSILRDQVCGSCSTR
jgi:hypothetical protein